MTTKFFRWFATAILVAVLFTCNSVRAQTRIAHTSQGFRSFQYAVINNAGEVCFSATKINGAGHAVVGVYKGSGGGVSTVLEADLLGPPGQLVPLGNNFIAMNDSGLVGVIADGFGGTSHAYATRDRVTDPAKFVAGFQVNAKPPTFSINNNNYLGAGPLVFQLDSNGNQPLLNPPNPQALFEPCPNCYGLLNNHNQLLLSLLDSTSGDTRLSRLNVGVVKENETSHVKTLGITSSTLIISIHAPTTVPSAMNDSGTVAYMAAEGNGMTAIFRTGGGAGFPYVEFRDPNAPPETGPDLNRVGDDSFAINSSGQVAFLAFSRALGKTAIFRGPNALTDKIVASGDIVAGSRIELSAGGLFGTGHWFNDGGEVVFKAFDDTGEGLWVTGTVASPPLENPTPTSTFEWNSDNSPPPMPPNGSFGDTDNWVPLDGPDDRVPEKTSQHADIALFDRAEAYTVELGTRHNDRLIVRSGDVLFVNGSYLADHLAPDFPAVLIDNARLSLLTGMLLTNNHALIGETAGTKATVSVGFGGSWNSSSLTVGGNGKGILEVNAAGTVISAESLIGDGPGGGEVTVKDSGSWKTGNLAIGAVGKGSLTIQDGGNVKSDQALIGHAPGTDHVVTVQGVGSDRSTWNTSELTVAQRGDGRLEVKGGASVIVGLSTRIADSPGVTGSVTISGVGPSSRPSSLFCIGLDVGPHGDGSLIIEDGGNVEVDLNAVLIGSASGGTGNVLIRGSTLMLASLPGQGQSLTIVRGKMRIEAGGLVRSRIGAISTGTATKANEVVISDAASNWTIDEQLFVGGELIDINGQNGKAILTLSGGSVQANRILLGTGGTIHGNGFIYVPDPTNPVENNGGTLDLSGVQVDIPLQPANVPRDTGASRSRRTIGLQGPEPPALGTNVLTILGSYKQSPNGRLLIGIGGTNSADYDHLIITNAATLDGNVTFKFINGFAPKAGDHFDFLSVGGTLRNTFATVGLQNLAPGFQFNLVTNGPMLCMTALNNGVFDPTLPGQVDVTLTNVGGLTYARHVLTTGNTCQRITPDGALTRASNVFSRAFQGTTFIGGGCADETDSITNTVLLGALPPGDYSFRILANTQTVQTVAFTVPPNAGKTLLAARRLPDGGVQFQIDGLAPTPYAIEASEDLQNWIELGSGILPAAFTDPDAAIFRTRFYRAQIGP